jgi:hypothetical protein
MKFMKNKWRIAIAAVVLCSWMPCASVLAQSVGTEFESDGIRYMITSDETCTVIQNPSQPYSSADIPEYAYYNANNSGSMDMGGTDGMSGMDGTGDMSGTDDPYGSNGTTDPSYSSGGVSKEFRVTDIDDFAFSGCQLASLTIPKTITKLRPGIFSSIMSINSLTLPESIESIDDELFKNLNIYTFEIPSSVKSIGRSAFEGSNVNFISFPNNSSLSTIGAYAFFGCQYLSGVDLPNSVTSLGEYAFANCPNLNSVSLSTSMSSIAAHTFESSNITSIYNVSSIKEIGDYAFDRSMIWDPNNTFIGIHSLDGFTSLETIGVAAFQCCTAMSFDFSDLTSLKSIGDGAFISCSNNMSLRPLKLPDSVTDIHEGAFAGCSFTDIKLSESLTEIKEYTFQGALIDSLIIPNSVKSIDAYAFAVNGNLKKIVLPTSLEYIDENAFDMCSGIEEVICPIYYPVEIEEPVWAYRLAISATLYVPSYECIERYRNAVSWREFPNIVAPNLPITTDPTFGYSTFYWDQSVIIPEGLTAYTGKLYNDVIRLTQLHDVIPEHTPVILHGDAGCSYTLYATTEKYDSIKTSLSGTLTDIPVDMREDARLTYTLSCTTENGVSKNLGFYLYTGSTLAAHKAYLRLDRDKAPIVRIVYDEDPGVLTGITEIQADPTTESPIYDVTGRRVREMKQRGLYITNGRKILIK